MNGQLQQFLDVRKSQERQASKKRYDKCSENSRSQIVFRTDIFRKLSLGAPVIYVVPLLNGQPQSATCRYSEGGRLWQFQLAVIGTFYPFCDGLQLRSVLGSIGVLFMSCKVNFHVVRSALQIYVLLLESQVQLFGMHPATLNLFAVKIRDFP